MKKILLALLIIAAICFGGYKLWEYFSVNYQEYNKFYEVGTSADDKLYFLDEMFVKQSGNNVTIYKITEDDAGEIYSKTMNSPEIVFTSADFIVIKEDALYYVYYEQNEKFMRSLLPNEKLCSIHQYGDSLCIKMVNNENKTTIYKVSTHGLIKSVSVDFDFVDYCIDPLSGSEYYISYELSGEYVKLVIKKFDSGKQIGYISIDNFVYNDIDCIGDMIVFYTDHSMMFVNTRTSVRRTQNYYDIDNLKKFIFDDKIVYCGEENFFNGINNLLIVKKDVSDPRTLKTEAKFSKLGDQLVYLEDNCVKLYPWSSSLIDDSIMFTVENAKDVNAMKNIIAVIKDGKVEFMKVAE